MNNEIDNLISKANIAISDLDCSDSERVLYQILEFANRQNIDEHAAKELETIVPRLYVVAFSTLSDSDCARVLKNYYLVSFDINVDMEDQLIAKLFSVPLYARNNLRSLLRRALLENVEKIGELALGNWIREFDRTFNPITRNYSASVQFIAESTKSQSLTNIEKARLKNILHTYDYLLIYTLPVGEPELSQLLASGELRRSDFPTDSDVVYEKERKNVEPASFDRREELKRDLTKASIPISINIHQALAKYPQFGEQLITSSPIKLKIFPQPVRPSIKNWIEDYRQVMGAQRHGMMERGNYLFHSENTRSLPSGDRKKLAEILRSLDEDVTLKIDPDRQEVVFDQEDFSNMGAIGKTPQPPVSPRSGFSPSSQRPPVPPVQRSAIPPQSYSVPTSESFPEEKIQNTATFPPQNTAVQKPSFQSVSSRRDNRSERSFSQTQHISAPTSPSAPLPAQPLRPAPQTQLSAKDANIFSTAARNIQMPRIQTQRPAASSYQSNAGKSWEEINREEDAQMTGRAEPKLRGNVVDLKN